MAELKSIFDDLPMTQWETLETDRYWKQMRENGWNQNVDQILPRLETVQVLNFKSDFQIKYFKIEIIYFVF